MTSKLLVNSYLHFKLRFQNLYTENNYKSVEFSLLC